jgi:L-idonate 5-dehydrogenase
LDQRPLDDPVEASEYQPVLHDRQGSGKLMKAVVVHAAHDLRIEELEAKALEAGEVRVKMAAGGICGSDLHYYHEGGIGDFPVREPMVLGHEMAGTVAELGPGVDGPPIGTKVAVNPTLPCGTCSYCTKALQHLCPNVRFAGSSRTFPHSQGFFAEYVTVRAEQLRPVPADMPIEIVAMAEPLSVCLHAVSRAGSLLGQRVMVTGAGPIGCLTVAAARLAGAGEIIVTDLVETCLAKAREVGADHTIDVAGDRSALDDLQTATGTMDVVLECSGSPKAVIDGLKAVRRGGTVVQVGILPRGAHPIPIDLVVGKELNLHGSFRFVEEFDWAVNCLVNGLVDVKPLLTQSLPLTQAVEAFDLAGDRQRAMKVQLVAA